VLPTLATAGAGPRSVERRDPFRRPFIVHDRREGGLGPFLRHRSDWASRLSVSQCSPSGSLTNPTKSRETALPSSPPCTPLLGSTASPRPSRAAKSWRSPLAGSNGASRRPVHGRRALDRRRAEPRVVVVKLRDGGAGG